MTISSSDLSEREREILILIVQGASNKEIARHLMISPNTVKVHLRNIFGKIGAHSRTEAAMYAVKMNMAGTGSPQIEEETDSLVESISQPVSEGQLERSETEWITSKKRRQQRNLLISGLVFILFVGMIGVYLYIYRSNKAVESTSSNNMLEWKTMAKMPTARYGLASAGFEGYIYSIGGTSSSGVTGVVERYDVQQNKWQSVTSKPVPVTEVNAVVVGGKIYVPGGKLANGQLANVLEIYDTRTDRWSVGAPLPQAVSGYGLASYEGNIYLFGGWDGQKFVSNVYEYNSSEDLWREKTPLPSEFGYMGVAVASNKLIIVGGFDGRRSLKDVWFFSPDLDAIGAKPWEKAAALPRGRYAMGITSLAEIIEVVGGNEGQVEQSSLSYFPIFDSWQAFTTLENGSPEFPGLVGIGNYIYLIGGRLNGQPTNRVVSYQAIYSISFPIIIR